MQGEVTKHLMTDGIVLGGGLPNWSKLEKLLCTWSLGLSQFMTASGNLGTQTCFAPWILTSLTMLSTR